MKRWSVLPMILLSACVTTTVNVVVGPDGRKALLIQAPTQLEALTKAHEECPEGYEILNSTTAVSGLSSVQPGIGSSLEMLIRCKRESSASSDEWYASTTAQAVDDDPCRSVSSEVDDFLDFWADFSGVEQAGKRPPVKDFVGLCDSMPVRVRACFKTSYRKVHNKLCRENFTRLDDAHRNKLNVSLNGK